MSDLKTHLQTRTFIGGALAALLLATSVQLYKRGVFFSDSSPPHGHTAEFPDKGLLAWLSDVGGWVRRSRYHVLSSSSFFFSLAFFPPPLARKSK